MKRRFNISIKLKFFMLVALSSILPIIVLSFYSYRTSVKFITEQTRSRSETTLNRVSAFIDLYLQHINTYAVNISNNSIITNSLTDITNDPFKYIKEKHKITAEMHLPYNNVTLPIKSIIISSSDQYFSNFFINEDKLTDAVKRIKTEDWYLQNNKFTDSTRFIGVRESYIKDFETAYHYYFYHNICDNEGRFLGVLLIDISSYVIDRLLSSIINNDDDIIYLLDEQSNVLSVSNEMRNTENRLNLMLSPKDRIIAKAQLINKDWNLIYSISYKSISNGINRIILFTVGLIIILLIFEFFLYLFVNKTVTKPIMQLVDAMKKVQKSDFEVKFNVVSNDEIGILANGFNKMVMDTKIHIEKIKQEERQAKKFELAMLQAQINPHFLYNSLSSIKFMADLMRAGNISQAILKALVTAFQYSL